MSLSEKLSTINKKLQEEKELQAQEAQNKELSPIREKIKELEEVKRQLDLIKGSLEVKSQTGTGKGMKEYSSDVKNKVREENKNIDSLIEENKEALKTMGVSNKEELISNSEFENEPEVINYKEANLSKDDLERADEALGRKLGLLGVNVDDSKTYEDLEKKINERIISLESELNSEKLKTPEGKNEVINELSRNIEKELRVSGSIKPNLDEVNINLSNYEKLDIKEGKVSFKDWYNISLPEVKNEYKQEYSEDMLKEAYKKAYDSKIENLFNEVDLNNFFLKKFKNEIEIINPENVQKAREGLNKLSELKKTFLQALESKSKELKEKGIDFDPERPVQYGGTYDELSDWAYRTDQEKISNYLKETPKFPPEYNYIKIESAFNKKIEKMNKFIEAVNNLKTEKDILNFEEEKGIISQYRVDLNEMKLYEFSYDSRHSGIRWSKIESLNEPKTYSEIKGLVDEKEQKFNDLKNNVINKVNAAIEAKFKRGELEKEVKIHRIRSGVEQEIQNIETNRKAALDLMSKLIGIESQLKDEEIFVSGLSIKVLSREKEANEIKNQIKEKEEKIEDLKDSISKHLYNKPKLFGKEKWENKHSKMNMELEGLTKSLNMSNEEYRKKYNESYAYIPLDRFSPIREVVENFKGEGKGSEIFGALKVKLEEIVNKTLPESLLKINQEYKDLQDKILK